MRSKQAAYSIEFRIPHRMLNILVPQVLLNGTCVLLVIDIMLYSFLAAQVVGPSSHPYWSGK
jgi:hypothetical protein